jgi:hypothetical protein
MKLSHRMWRRRKQDLDKCFVIPINVGDIRAKYMPNGNQLFAVTDLALWKNPAHAVVLLSVRSSENEARRARTILMGILPKYCEISKAFSADDKWGWSRGLALQALAFLRALKGSFL